MHSRFEQFSYVISGVYRYVQKIERDEMEQLGFRGSFAQYLAALDRYPNGITAKDLCIVCDKDKAAVSRAMKEMVQKGLALRVGAAYRAKLMLTEAGRQAAEQVRIRASKVVALVSGELSEGEREIFYETLGKMAANLKSISEDGMPKE